MAQPQRFKISNGPLKHNLSAALFEGDGTHRRPVGFMLEDGSVVDVIVNGVEREDGGGQHWLFSGYRPHPKRDIPVRGYYSTSLPEGWIEF